MLLVGAQLLLLLGLIITGPVLPRSWPLVFVVLGGLLGLWAVITMRRSQWRIVPEPHPSASLVTDGPYRWVRHPMYTSVLLIATGWILATPTIERALLGFALLGVLIIKLTREEQLWCQRHDAYAAYREKTWRLLPGMY